MKIYVLFIALYSTYSMAIITPKSATVYEVGSKRSKILFNVDIENKANLTTMTWKNTDRSTAAISQMKIENGVLTEYKYKRQMKGTKENSKVVHEAGKIKYSHERNGEKTSKIEDSKKDYLVDSMVIRFIQANWKKLMAGEELNIQYGVLSRKTSIKFNIFKEGEKIVMRVSNYFFRVFVKPVIFEFSEDGNKVLTMTGRMLPFDAAKADPVGIDGEMVFKY